MVAEKYEALLQANAKDPEMLETICDYVDTFRKYVNSVIAMETGVSMARYRYEGEPEKYQEVVQNYDKSRRICHESAIAACRVLNRISERSGLEPFYEGDTEGRYQVADFCMRSCEELFYKGQPNLQNRIANGEVKKSLQKIDKEQALEMFGVGTGEAKCQDPQLQM